LYAKTYKRWSFKKYIDIVAPLQIICKKFIIDALFYGEKGLNSLADKTTDDI
jgi:hypothetical protein